MTILTTKSMALVRQVSSDLLRHEGFREYAYPDVLSKLFNKYRSQRWGYRPAREILAEIGVKYDAALRDGAPWTVGIGFTSGVTPDSRMTKLQSMRMLEGKVIEVDGALSGLFPSWYQSAPMVVKTVMINMVFNMGLGGFLGFKNTIRYIKEGNYRQAAANMRKSLWYRQVTTRAEELARRMERQEIEAADLAPDNLC